ncbi:MAG: Na+/H+ antiporter NhaA [Actinobacteria bacterium]|nr:MAG: Na+/H+ antiporter NhaA [Actinomycetota bacterium]
MTQSRPTPTAPRRLLQRPPLHEVRYLADLLRTETVGGGLLFLGAVLALLWANSPWADRYESLRGFVPWPGGEPWHLGLTLSAWVTDGLLAVFFFVVGLELKRELVIGELSDPRRAVLPMIAAMGGMVAPAAIYVAVNAGGGAEALRGWAVPTATDIAFALAVLAVVGSRLPASLRSFLLTLAVVDDLLAITIIAVFYTGALAVAPLLAACVPLGLFALVVRAPRAWWWALPPLAVATWGLVHVSGVHATIAGVLLGFTVPVRPRPGERSSLAERFAHVWHPISAGVVLPVFAFFAAGVGLRGGGFVDAFRDPAAIGVTAGLVVGKLVGILGATYLVARFTRAELAPDLTWADVLGVALLGGIGFTVSLLIGELAFGADSVRGAHVTIAVLTGSLLSALLASAVLLPRNAVRRG